jgi:hypothetical protein
MPPAYRPASGSGMTCVKWERRVQLRGGPDGLCLSGPP